MPLVKRSTFNPSKIWRGPHRQTLTPHFFRRPKFPATFSNVILSLSDGDFLELDHYRNDSDTVAILSHGFEGSARRPYILGMGREFFTAGFDIIAWNFRDCGKQRNLKAYSYHSGKTEDLDEVIKFALSKGYSKVVLIGFSMGGNLSLKYLGEGRAVPEEIKACVVFSVPCDLESTCLNLDRGFNRVYRDNFISTLRVKLRHKVDQGLVTHLSFKEIKKLKTFSQFDNELTAPLNGFESAVDYWTKCSSGQFIPNVKVPSLIVSAHDDPMLGKKSYPYEYLEQSHYVFGEFPNSGGHVGFFDGKFSKTWSELRALDFVLESLS